MLEQEIQSNGSTNYSDINRLAHLRTKPLTPQQERRLVAYLDEQFLTLTGGFKKRTSTTSHVPTLHKYIHESRKLLSFILQIPPVDPSAQLRVQFMLRLTGDALSAIAGYWLIDPKRQRSLERGEGDGGENEGGDGHPRDYTTALKEVLDWLDDLDQAWVAVLQSQVWDPEMGEGVDLILSTNSGTSPTSKSTPISQTDATRLRSLLVTNIANLEEWLTHAKPSPSTTNGTGEDDVAGMLERLGLLGEFDDLFSQTMYFLGGFGGGYVEEPETIVQDGLTEGDEEDMSDMVEVVMSGCS